MRHVEPIRRPTASLARVPLLASALSLVLVSWPPGTAHAVELSRGIQDLNISYEECLARAHQAFIAEGYRANPSRGEGFVAGFKDNLGSYINCTGIQTKRMSVIVMVASEGVVDTSLAGSERVRLMQRMSGTAPPTPVPPQASTPPPTTGVTWYTKAKADSPDGQRLSFSCPPLGSDGFQSIWGTDVYTFDSGICMAGVHVGVITRERGGVVSIEMRPGQSSYASTLRNGVSSQGYGAYNKSFAVLSSSAYRAPAGGAAEPGKVSREAGQDAACNGFTGSWSTDFGPVQITVQGSRASGTYPDYKGTIDATVMGNVLEGRWIQPDRRGVLRWTLSADGSRFSGTWGNESGIGGGTWGGVCARR